MLKTILKKKTKIKKEMDRQNSRDRTPGQMVKAKLYRQNHTKKHTHTHLLKE